MKQKMDMNFSTLTPAQFNNSIDFSHRKPKKHIQSYREKHFDKHCEKHQEMKRDESNERGALKVTFENFSSTKKLNKNSPRRTRNY